MMRHERHVTRRLQMTDIGKVGAVALRGEVTDREPLESLQERILLEGRHYLVKWGVNARAAARTEMSDVLHGVKDALRIVLAGKHGDGHRAANVRRVTSGMDRIIARDDPANRDRSGRRAGRAGIGHHRAGHDGRTHIKASMC
jgi:hypothetical protein